MKYCTQIELLRMTDAEDRRSELLALSSIFGEDGFQSTADDGGELQIKCKASEDLVLLLNEEERRCALQAGGRVKEEEGKFLRAISFLPPLKLKFVYPNDYPSCSAPVFTVSCSWLSLRQLSKLCDQLDQIWKENKGDVIVFLWASYLENDALSDIGITNTLKVEYSPVRGRHPVSEDLLETQKSENETQHQDSHSLTSFEDVRVSCFATSQESTIKELVTCDLHNKAKVFETSTFTCGICYDDIQGSDCTSFVPCQHVYCKICIKEHFAVNITEGRVLGLCCPETDCDAMAIQGQVKELVSEDLFARYDRLLLQTSLDGMEDVVYCPRLSCRSPVVKEDGDNLALCPACRFVFCTLCSKPNHGIFDCQKAKREMIAMMKRMKEEEARRLEEENAKDISERIKREMEEAAGEVYVFTKSKKCPSCGFHIQKNMGCNKMTCSRCFCNFCWICMKKLDNKNSYQHFEDESTSCYKMVYTAFDEDEDIT